MRVTSRMWTATSQSGRDSSIKAKAALMIRSAWRDSLETAAMPRTAELQMSFSPTSATATSNLFRTRCTNDRTTCRLSLSDLLEGI